MKLPVKLALTYKAGSTLGKNELPRELPIQPRELDAEKLNLLKKVVENFNSDGDLLLTEIFSEFYENAAEISVSVVATDGIPAPYDAWTSTLEGEKVIFFNLSEWSEAQLECDANSVLLHEVTHTLLEPLLGEASASPIERMNRLVLNEGIAHFVGFGGDRDEILKRWVDREAPAEKKLNESLALLEAEGLSSESEAALLEAADTGSYWEKFGAIAGLFRAARRYQESGANGLIAAIREQTFT